MDIQHTTNNQKLYLQKLAKLAMREHGFLPEFSKEVEEELRTITGPASVDQHVRDLTELPWCSIDNDDSLDLDQLTVAVPIDHAQTRIVVAIADVDCLVPKGSKIDGHAHHNTTSLYTDVEIFPMLPTKLSNDFTSLNPQEKRRALVFDMKIATNGEIQSYEIYEALVYNHAKLAYNGVAAWLEGEGPLPEALKDLPQVAENIKIQWGVAQHLEEKRRRNGSLNFTTIKTKATFENDTIKDLQVEENNVAKHIIEECMIAANSCSADFLFSKKFPSLRRIVRVPKRWERIVEIAAQWRVRLPDAPDSEALDRFLRKAHKIDSLRFPDLSLSIIKLLGPGEYVVEKPGESPIGHFGLAIKDYAHSTAPNRRYPDIITQRLLKAALHNVPMPYTFEELEELAGYCTDGEDEAKKFERKMTKSVHAILMRDHIGEKFQALVTGTTEHSVFVRILYPPIEGKLILFNDKLDVGDRVTVKLVSIDVEKGFIDFKALS